ncbi:hypothetical protein [Bradyrhizobium sp. CW10]|uniref:hypothetical protein n=1 Tax=Bradyrhizobium sp. CW10 TaxID=2782683 RepID=UPI0031F89437
MPALRLIDLRYSNRGIEGRKLFLNGPHEQRAQILDKLVGRARRCPALVLGGLDVFLPERRIRQITRRLTEAIENTALIRLGELIEVFKL